MLPKRRAALGLLLLLLSGWCRGAAAAQVSESGYPALPQAERDFDQLVEKLERETKGKDAAMAARLRAFGFTCAPLSHSASFECVRFGCRSGGLLWRGALLQWTVEKRSFAPGKAWFRGGVVDYGWLISCLPRGDIERTQQKFISGGSLAQ